MNLTNNMKEVQIVEVLVVKESEENGGELRPMAGIWKDNEAGEIGSLVYLKKNKEDLIVKAKLIEI